MLSCVRSLCLSASFLLIAVGHANAAAPSQVSGRATALTGDTIRVERRVVRLWGVDAPEFAQHCEDPNGKAFLCGDESHRALSAILRGKQVICIDLVPDERPLQVSRRSKQYVATCFLGDVNLNAKVVREGWALAYVPESREFVNEQRLAREEKAGIWTRVFQKPWIWRAGVLKNRR